MCSERTFNFWTKRQTSASHNGCHCLSWLKTFTRAGKKDVSCGAREKLKDKVARKSIAQEEEKPSGQRKGNPANEQAA